MVNGLYDFIFRIPDGTYDFIFNKNIRNKDTRVENLKTKQNILRLRSENVGDSNVITKPPPIAKFMFRDREAKLLQLKLYET